nr:YczI family protein [Paucisalibacillus globulus]
MLKILRIVFSIVTMGLAVYGLTTQNFEYGHVMILFLGLMMLVLGIEEFQKGKKRSGWLSIIVSLFAIIVSIQGFFMA